MHTCGVIFDCDGTLVDSLSQALESFNYALIKVGEQPRTPEEIKRYFGAGADRILSRILGDEKKGLEAFRYYLDHQSQLAGGTRLHNEVRDLLDCLSAEGIAMAVVTGRHAEDLNVLLKPHNINDYFVTLIADNHAPQSKPAPDGVLMAVQRMGLKPERTFYVGDAVSDMQAARAAGSIAIGAVWDRLAKEEDLKAANADFIATEPMHVWQYFQQHFLNN